VFGAMVRVVLTNISSDRRLNGAAGRVFGFEGDRVCVRLDSGGRLVKVKCSNLNKEGGAADADAEGGIGGFAASIGRGFAAARESAASAVGRSGESEATRELQSKLAESETAHTRTRSELEQTRSELERLSVASQSEEGRPAPVRPEPTDELRARLARVARLQERLEGAHAGLRNAPSLPDKLRGLDVSRFPGGALDDLGQALREASETVSHEVTRRREADATEARTCVVCLENDRDVVFMPCFHMVSCWACGLRVSECPTCRAPIDQKRRVYQ